MKRFLILTLFSILLFSCQKETVKSDQSYQNKQSDQLQLAARKGKGHNLTVGGLADFAHYYEIRDTVVTVNGEQKLGIIYHLQTPLPDGFSQMYMGLNSSPGDSTTAVPAQSSPMAFVAFDLNFNPDYGWWYDANSFPGQGLKTYWWVGCAGSNPYDATTYTVVTGSAFIQVDF